MSRKPENVFISAVHKHMPNTHTEKMNNPYRSGTADVWYSGKRDCWIEYKWIPALPVRKDVLADLTPQQQRWLWQRFHEGRTVAVIVGCPQGGVILPDISWMQPMTAQDFRFSLRGRKEVAAWILAKVGESPCLSSAPFSVPQKSSVRRTGSSSRRSSSTPC